MAEFRQEGGTLTGLTDQEAQEFHGLFVKGFAIFTVIAVVAHILVWMWRPWLPGPEGYSALESTVHIATYIGALVSESPVASTLLRG
jgi:light-harvesting complex 1 beta chain